MRSSRSSPIEAPAWLTAAPYAHRGLHGAGRVENSRAAFEAAIAAGFGIELDVQLSRDGRAMVFHDYALDRLTGETGKVAKRAADELASTKLRGQDEGISTLAEILALIADRAPVLVEVKADGSRVAALCRDVARSLDGYDGRAAAMSFNPEVGRWFAAHAAKVMRGLVVSEAEKKGLRGRIERRLAIWRAQPQFLACDIRDLPSRFADRARARGLPILTWTVRNARDAEAASVYADQIIHELPTRNGR